MAIPAPDEIQTVSLFEGEPDKEQLRRDLLELRCTLVSCPDEEPEGDENADVR